MSSSFADLWSVRIFQPMYIKENWGMKCVGIFDMMESLQISGNITSEDTF